MKIVWTQPAVEDLYELHAYIARDSELYASGFVERLISAVEVLEGYPRLGRIVPSRKAMMRVFASFSISTIDLSIALPKITSKCCQ